LRLGLLADYTLAERPGGAQRFADRMLRAVPAEIDVIPCPPGAVDRDCDAYMLYLSKRYAAAEYEHVLSRPFVRFEQDYWRDFEGGGQWRDRLNAQARLVAFCSPLHREVYQAYHHSPNGPTECIPCPLDPAELVPYRAKWDERGREERAIWYGEWNWFKAPDIAQRWALDEETPTDFYSPTLPAGLAPPNPYCHFRGFGAEDDWWDTVARHTTFVHFPRQPECWPWSVHEAYLLGLEVIIAGRFGIESYDGGLTRAIDLAVESPQRWWEVALNALS
jgi:hypothetical protein